MLEQVVVAAQEVELQGVVTQVGVVLVVAQQVVDHLQREVSLDLALELLVFCHLRHVVSVVLLCRLVLVGPCHQCCRQSH